MVLKFRHRSGGVSELADEHDLGSCVSPAQRHPDRCLYPNIPQTKFLIEYPARPTAGASPGARLPSVVPRWTTWRAVTGAFERLAVGSLHLSMLLPGGERILL